MARQATTQSTEFGSQSATLVPGTVPLARKWVASFVTALSSSP